jgi:hypothetical protein
VTSEFENYFGETKEQIRKRIMQSMDGWAPSTGSEASDKQKTISDYSEEVAEAGGEEGGPAIKETKDNSNAAVPEEEIQEKSIPWKIIEGEIVQPSAAPVLPSKGKVSVEKRFNAPKGKKGAKPSLEKPSDSQTEKPESKTQAKTRFSESDEISAQIEEALEDDIRMPFEKPVEKEERAKRHALKPIKRENPVKVRVKKEASQKEDKQEKVQAKKQSSPVNKVVAKQDLSGLKELDLSDLKK